jgi:hypothetical protein
MNDEIRKFVSELEAQIAYVSSPECPPAGRSMSVTDVRILAIGKALSEIDARLRALEPCPKSECRPHAWAPVGKKFADPGDPIRCIYCGVERKSD